jgi:PAS domain S-box-containing protein
MIIDSHCHAWTYWPYEPPVPDPQSRGTVEQLVDKMDLNGVDRATIVSAQITHNPDNNDYIAECVRRYPGRLYQYADVDCSWSETYHTPGAAKRLEQAAERWPIKGFTHYLARDDDGDWLTSQEGLDFFGVAAELVRELGRVDGVPGDLRSRAVGALEHAASSVMNETRDAEGVRPDGTRFPLEFISKPYLYRGRVVQVTGFRDVTERKEMEFARQKTRELELANRRLVEVDQMRTRILNVASHELNTPITPLRMQVHLLKNKGYGDLNDKQLNAVNILDRNLERLSLLVRDILDVSKIEAGRLRVKRGPMEIDLVIEETVRTFNDVARDRDIHLTYTCEGAGWVIADNVRIAQVISNLLTNALKFTEPGGHINVVLKRCDERLRLEVQDDGVGLEPAQIARLFQPFEQVHDTMEVTQNGSGLGLFICKGILEAHDGEIGIESAGPGKGTTAWLELPEARSDEMHAET